MIEDCRPRLRSGDRRALPRRAQLRRPTIPDRDRRAFSPRIPPRCPSSPACWCARAPRRLPCSPRGGVPRISANRLSFRSCRSGRSHAEDRDGRIDHALWTEGQIALEFPPAAARDLQDRAAGRHGRSARPVRAPGANPGPPVHRAPNASGSPSSRARRTGPYSCGARRKAWPDRRSATSRGRS
jgi:hypothetical protein